MEYFHKAYVGIVQLQAVKETQSQHWSYPKRRMQAMLTRRREEDIEAHFV